jgi:MFS family permease
MYYAVFLFQQAGISGTTGSLLANGIQGVVLNIFTLPNMYYMDKWGRRTPMIIGGIGMGVSMMIIGVLMKTLGMDLPEKNIAYLKLTSTGDPVYDSLTKKTNFVFASNAASLTTIAFVYIYVAVFALTWACVAWVYPPEIFSMNMRGRATSMTTATNWFVVITIHNFCRSKPTNCYAEFLVRSLHTYSYEQNQVCFLHLV